jgi:hypothetical protein
MQGRDGVLHWLATEGASMNAVRRLPEEQQVLEQIADVLAGRSDGRTETRSPSPHENMGRGRIQRGYHAW